MNLSVDELLNALPASDETQGAGNHGATVTNACRVLGVSHNRVKRWARDGLTVDEADDMAGRLKVHPFDIWGQAWNVALVEQVEADEARALATRGVPCEHCGTVFVPERLSAHKRFCATSCKQRASWHRRTANWTPEQHEAERARIRAYKQAAARVQKIKRDAYYHANKDEVKARRQARYAANRDVLNARRRAARKAA